MGTSDPIAFPRARASTGRTLHPIPVSALTPAQRRLVLALIRAEEAAAARRAAAADLAA